MAEVQIQRCATLAQALFDQRTHRHRLTAGTVDYASEIALMEDRGEVTRGNFNCEEIAQLPGE